MRGALALVAWILRGEESLCDSFGKRGDLKSLGGVRHRYQLLTGILALGESVTAAAPES